MISSTEDSLFQCPICLEEFIEPKALPCLHSFCKVCIGEYIRSSGVCPDSLLSFYCPVCRKEMKIPSCKDPAESLQDNYIIKNLKEKNKGGDDKSLLCSFHKQKRLEFYCPYHDLLICSKCLLANHRTCNITEIADAIESKRQNIEDIKARMVFSKEELQSRVEVLEARKCNVMLHASKCKESVKLYSDEIRGLITMAETSLIREIDRLENMQIKLCDDDLLNSKENINVITTTLTEVKASNLPDGTDYFMFRDIYNKLNKVQQQIRAKNLSPLSQETSIKFHPDMDVFNIFEKENILGKIGYGIPQLKIANDNLISKTVTGILSRPKRNDFVEKVESQTTQKNGKTNKNSRSLESRFNSYHSKKSFNTTDNRKVKDWSPPSNAANIINSEENEETEKKLELQKKANFQTQMDKMNCFITGIAIFNDDSIVVADHGNTKLKLYDKECKVINQKAFSSEPWSVCLTEDDDFVVSFPSENLIQSFEMKKQRVLSKPEKLTTNGRCYGLSYHTNKIAVCVRRANGSFIAVYSNMNVLISEIQTFRTPSLSENWYVTFSSDGNNLVYTDENTNSVTCFDFQFRKEIWKQTISTPRGIAVFGNKLYVASRSSRSLKCLSEADGIQEAEITCSNIADVNVVAINKNNSKLVVSVMDGADALLFS